MKKPRARSVKIHRSYTVKELAELLAVHTNTVRRWIKSGLQIVENTRPNLILGQDARTFLQTRRASECPCSPEEMYCFRCRAPKAPAGGMVDERPVSGRVVNVSGICPDCDCMMYRCVKVTELDQFREKVYVPFPQALRRISEINQPSVNSDLRGDV